MTAELDQDTRTGLKIHWISQMKNIFFKKQQKKQLYSCVFGQHLTHNSDVYFGFDRKQKDCVEKHVSAPNDSNDSMLWYGNLHLPMLKVNH